MAHLLGAVLGKTLERDVSDVFLHHAVIAYGRQGNALSLEPECNFPRRTGTLHYHGELGAGFAAQHVAHTVNAESFDFLAVN